jgi:hypothetical protein
MRAKRYRLAQQLRETAARSAFPYVDRILLHERDSLLAITFFAHAYGDTARGTDYRRMRKSGMWIATICLQPGDTLSLHPWRGRLQFKSAQAAQELEPSVNLHVDQLAVASAVRRRSGT